jgi:glyoxylase-like metal-dependent hydrolase (beta-lactamase superfamily II)
VRAVAVRLYALTCGWLTGPMQGFLDGVPGTLRVPVPVFLVDHPAGKVLFDSGLHPDAGRDPTGRLGVAARVFTVELRSDEDVAGRLARLNVDVRRIRFLVNSHLHFDHTGGNALVPDARVVVQRAEWDAGHDADLAARNFYAPHDYDTGHDVVTVDGEHDLFGDGRVVCLPTPGHTPGHQSLRVRLDDGADVVLAADACYLRRTLEALHLPAVLHDREAMLASLHRLRALQAAGARIVYGHDPESWATVAQAPEPFGLR